MALKTDNRVSPFRRYRIYLEVVLPPSDRRDTIKELHKRGWIHPNVENVMPTPDGGLMEVCCTPELLGKIMGVLTYNFGYVTINEVD